MWVVTCDPGIDDAVALVTAAGLPGFGPAAIVAAAGNVPVGTGWRNAVGLAALLGLDVPVGLGGEDTVDGTPIVRGPSSHGADGLGGLASRLPVHLGGPLDGGPLVRGDVVATGPLSEVARAQRAGNVVERVVWMGGSVPFAHGADAVGAEFNAAADPAAVAQVLAAQADLAIVPVELTLRFTFRAEDLDAWRTGSTVAQLCADLVDRRIAVTGAGDATPLHDPVAVLAAAEPGLFEWEEHRLSCEPSGSLRPDPTGGPARVAVDVDVDAGRDRIVSLVSASGHTP